MPDKETDEELQPKYTRVKVYRIALKNGHYFDFCECSAGNEVTFTDDGHIVVKYFGVFIAAFALSEVAYATAMAVYRNNETFEVTDELPAGSPQDLHKRR